MARQPILDCDRKTIGYELLFRDGPNNTFPEVEPELATSRLLSEHFLATHYSTLGGKLGFVNFPYQSLINLVPNLFPKQSLVVEILENCPPTDELLTATIQLHNAGYMIALDDFVPSPQWLRFLPYIDIIKFDIREYSIAQAATFIEQYKHFNIQFLAEKVETYQEFETAKLAGFDYFQGYFFSRPEMIQRKATQSSFLSIIELCKEMANDPINFAEVERLISLDMSLSYKLLAYINSCCPSCSNINSFRQALIFLGEDKLRRFISLIAIASVQSDKPDSLYGLAIQRARFCELLAQQICDKSTQGKAFLTGMFSLLDSLLDKPLPDVMTSIVIDNDIKQALLHHQGILAQILSVAMAYQCVDWEKTHLLGQQLGLSDCELASAYDEATLWAANVLSKEQS